MREDDEKREKEKDNVARTGGRGPPSGHGEGGRRQGGGPPPRRLPGLRGDVVQHETAFQLPPDGEQFLQVLHRAGERAGDDHVRPVAARRPPRQSDGRGGAGQRHRDPFPSPLRDKSKKHDHLLPRSFGGGRGRGESRGGHSGRGLPGSQGAGKLPGSLRDPRGRDGGQAVRPQGGGLEPDWIQPDVGQREGGGAGGDRETVGSGGEQGVHGGDPRLGRLSVDQLPDRRRGAGVGRERQQPCVREGGVHVRGEAEREQRGREEFGGPARLETLLHRGQGGGQGRGRGQGRVQIGDAEQAVGRRAADGGVDAGRRAGGRDGGGRRVRGGRGGARRAEP